MTSPVSTQENTRCTVSSSGTFPALHAPESRTANTNVASGNEEESLTVRTSARVAAAALQQIQQRRPLRHVPGAGCRVWVDPQPDWFGPARGLGAWYPATVVKRMRRGDKVQIHSLFCDVTACFGTDVLPTSRVHLTTTTPPANTRDVRVGDECSSVSRMVWDTDGNLFYDAAPSKLFVGDLVLAHFQRGRGDANPLGVWFRGRVIATGILTMHPITRQSLSQQVCTVAYDDGDVEENIPYPNGQHLMRLEIGRENPSWLRELSVPIPSKRCKQAKQGRIASVEGTVKLEYDDPQTGQTVRESRAYNVVLQALIQDRTHRAAAEKKAPYEWPYLDEGIAVAPPLSLNPTKTTRRSSRKFSSTRKRVPQHLGPETDDEEPGRRTALVRKSKRKSIVRRWDLPVHDIDTDSGTDSGDTSDTDDYATEQEGPSFRSSKHREQPCSALKQTKNRSQSVATAKRRKIATSKSSKRNARTKSDLLGRGKSVAHCAPESPLPNSTLRHVADNLQKLKPMPESLATTIGKAINGPEPHLGGDLLNHIASRYDRGPTGALYLTLIKLVVQGPQSGSVSFPDCDRLRIGQMGLEELQKLPGVSTQIISLLTASHWENGLEQLASHKYTAPGDVSRYSEAAFLRMGQNLHAKRVCSDFLLRLLSHQLAPEIAKDQINDEVFDLPFIFNIVSHRRGPKHGLEMVLKATTLLWIQHGHLVLAKPLGLFEQEHPSLTSRLFVQTQFRALSSSLGKICSYLSWIYMKHAHESVDDICVLISNFVCTAISETTFDPSSFLGAKANMLQHWGKVKFQFLTSLDKTIVPQLRPKLAEMLGVGAYYNAAFGD